jgi:short-subunit dehydrogenase
MTTTPRPLAAITGAATGIGLELARCCAAHGYDLLITADEPRIYEAAHELRGMEVRVGVLQTDLATRAGVDRFYAAAQGRPIEALFANAGRGLSGAFLDQPFDELRRIIEMNVTGTVYLVHKVAFDMRARGHGRILLTGSFAAFLPHTLQAVYDGTRAFLDAFTAALCAELRDSGVIVTCLGPATIGAELCERAGVAHTPLGTQAAADAAMARAGFAAIRNGEGGVLTGWPSKLHAAVRGEQQRERAERGSAGDPH